LNIFAATLTLFNYISIFIKTAANSIEIQNYEASVLDFCLRLYWNH